MASRRAALPIVLFGYDSSAFTQKVRLALRMRQIPYTFVTVPSMMPRPVLVSNFNLTYRKIPVLAIGKEVYIDTSLIIEALAEHPSYPPSKTHPPLHESPQHRTLARILASHYTDRPFFRACCGLMPQVVWESGFGVDRAGLIGHKLDPVKLGKKIPRHLAYVDTHLSILEPLFRQQKWFAGTQNPGAADIALFFMLDWTEKISRGEDLHNLTGGEVSDQPLEGMGSVFNAERYPGLMAWFRRFRAHIDGLSSTETRIEKSDETGISDAMSHLNAAEQEVSVPLLDTGVEHMKELDERSGLTVGVRVSVAPDDTGMHDPTLGTLVGLNSQEGVIVPDSVEGNQSRVEGARVHFPRTGFVVLPAGAGKTGLKVGTARL